MADQEQYDHDQNTIASNKRKREEDMDSADQQRITRSHVHNNTGAFDIYFFFFTSLHWYADWEADYLDRSSNCL